MDGKDDKEVHPPQKKARSTSPASLKSDTKLPKPGATTSKAKAASKAGAPSPSIKPEPSEPPTPSPQRNSKARVGRKQYSVLAKAADTPLEMDPIMDGDVDMHEAEGAGMEEEGLGEDFAGEFDGDPLDEQDLEGLGFPEDPEEDPALHGGFVEGFEGEEEEVAVDEEAEL